MRKIKKIICLILIAAMVSGVLISCGEKSSGNNDDNINIKENNEDKNNQENNGDDTNAGDSQDGETEENNGEQRIEPNLPDEDFGGYAFTFLSADYEGGPGSDYVSNAPHEITAEMQNTDDPISDAVYKRNMKIQSQYNIEIKLEKVESEATTLKKIVATGDAIYDAVLMGNNNIQGIVTGDMLTNIALLPYIDLAKPWWDPAVNAMSIDHRNFLLGGDLLILDNEGTNVLLFNKDLVKTLGMDLPYALAQEGKWTMDKFSEYIKGASMDLNGDGVMSPYDDRYGFVSFNDTFHALFVAGGGALALKDANDLPYMSFTSDRNISVLDKVMDIMYNKDDVLNVQADLPTSYDDWGTVFYGSFENNRALFLWARMRVVEAFRGMDSDFGILPLPKFDENQENYCSVVNPFTGALLGVPKSADNFERISVILEALSAESRYTLQPAYYDVVLQRKYARDKESGEMLDIIFNSRVYDIGAVYSFGNVFLDFIALCNKSDRNVASYYDKKINAMDKAINKVVETFQSMD